MDSRSQIGPIEETSYRRIPMRACRRVCAEVGSFAKSDPEV